jgi:hypothetical protein
LEKSGVVKLERENGFQFFPSCYLEISSYALKAALEAALLLSILSQLLPVQQQQVGGDGEAAEDFQFFPSCYEGEGAA